MVLSREHYNRRAQSHDDDLRIKLPPVRQRIDNLREDIGFLLPPRDRVPLSVVVHAVLLLERSNQIQD
jgi:hypothetical protein